MKYFDWDATKNEWLIKNRGVSFEICVAYIEQGYLLDTIQNDPPRTHQSVYIINVNGYAYRVPFVEDEDKNFLKTIYPSRNATKKYLQ